MGVHKKRKGYKNKNKKSYSQKLKELELKRILKRIDKYQGKDKPAQKKEKKQKNKKEKTAYQKEYYKYLRSTEWNEVRIEMLLSYPSCQRCGNKFGLQVHHKTYKNIFNEEPDDLEVLCKSCHRKEHKVL